ncbi:MAG: helix-turn-helix domain-containing protein [Anaerolineae bacterium]|nr:helix-turn-helix domain-containing protein [Anaerolineae bacterium]
MTRYVHPLNSKEVAAIQQLHRQTKEADVRSRCEMILLSAEGLPPPRIAERVRFSSRTVLRYIDRYEEVGIIGLLSKVSPGRPPRVTTAYLEQLEVSVAHWPRDLDLPFSNWTTENLATYMAQQTGIVIGARQMENYLKRYAWRLRRPVHSVKHKQDPEQVEEKKTNDGLVSSGAAGTYAELTLR